LFKALSTGLQFTAEFRLGRPLGSFKRPRPRRAHAYKSGRSLRQINLSLASLNQLATALAGTDAKLTLNLKTEFKASQPLADDMNDPVFAGVAEPKSRLYVKILKQSVDVLYEHVSTKLGPNLAVAAGFNALDGD